MAQFITVRDQMEKVYKQIAPPHSNNTNNAISALRAHVLSLSSPNMQTCNSHTNTMQTHTKQGPLHLCNLLN